MLLKTTVFPICYNKVHEEHGPLLYWRELLIASQEARGAAAGGAVPVPARPATGGRNRGMYDWSNQLTCKRTRVRGTILPPLET